MLQDRASALERHKVLAQELLPALLLEWESRVALQLDKACPLVRLRVSPPQLDMVWEHELHTACQPAPLLCTAQGRQLVSRPSLDKGRVLVHPPSSSLLCGCSCRRSILRDQEAEAEAERRPSGLEPDRL